MEESGEEKMSSEDILLLKILATIFLSLIAFAGVWWMFTNNPTYWREAAWTFGLYLIVALFGIHVTGEWVKKK